MNGASIISAVITAGHDGSAELAVRLRYEDGAHHDVVLDEPAARALMSACEAQTVEDLKGQSWERVRDALSVAWNRYSPAQQD